MAFPYISSRSSSMHSICEAARATPPPYSRSQSQGSKINDSTPPPYSRSHSRGTVNEEVFAEVILNFESSNKEGRVVNLLHKVTSAFRSTNTEKVEKNDSFPIIEKKIKLFASAKKLDERAATLKSQAEEYKNLGNLKKAYKCEDNAFKLSAKARLIRLDETKVGRHSKMEELINSRNKTRAKIKLVKSRKGAVLFSQLLYEEELKLRTKEVKILSKLSKYEERERDKSFEKIPVDQRIAATLLKNEFGKLNIYTVLLRKKEAKLNAFKLSQI